MENERIQRLYAYCHRLWPKFNLESRQAEHTIQFDRRVLETFQRTALETTEVFTFEELEAYWPQLNDGFRLVDQQLQQALETVRQIRDEMLEINHIWQRHIRNQAHPDLILLWLNASSLCHNCSLINVTVHQLYSIWRQLAMTVTSRAAPIIETAELFAGVPIIDEHFRENFPYYTTNQIDISDVVLGPGPARRQ